MSARAELYNFGSVNIAGISASEKTSTVSADKVIIKDSEDSGALKEVDVSNLSTSPIGTNGFIDYNDSTGSISISSDTWTDIPNDGQGSFSNSTYAPNGVTDFMDISTGYIDTTELSLGDTILIRNDYTVNPGTNNALLQFRYVLGNGANEYTLEKIVGRLDSGSGQNYRFSLESDLIYMGDLNTRDNPIKLQIKLSTTGTLTNAGSVIQLIRR